MSARLPIKLGTLKDRVAAQREVVANKIKQTPVGGERDVLIRRLNKLDLAAKRLNADVDLSADLSRRPDTFRPSRRSTM